MIEKILQNLIDKDKLNTTALSYYDKQDNDFWDLYFYKNITKIPFMMILGIHWSLDQNPSWDSNEAGRKKINEFLLKFDGSCIVKKTNGFPTYWIFKYFSLISPKKLNSLNNKNTFLESFWPKTHETNDIKFYLENKTLNSFKWILNYCNYKIQEHEKNLNELNKNIYFGYFQQWKEFYLEAINNNEKLNELSTMIKESF